MEKWDVEVIDENNLRRYGPRLISGGADHEFLQTQRPCDVAGFYGGLTSTIPRIYELARFYKQKGIVTIAGGQHFCKENIKEALSSGIDYVVIGELAQRMNAPENQLRFSRSALDLMRLGELYPALIEQLVNERPLLAMIQEGRDRLEAEIDAERRALIHANEQRLSRYEDASKSWMGRWPKLAEQIKSLPLQEAHRIIAQEAETNLPMKIS